MNTSENILIHSLETENKLAKFKTPLIVFLIISLGVTSGYLLSLNKSSSSLLSTPGKKGQQQIVVGSKDEKVFSDSTEGMLEAGGIDGEGTHKLIRPGGESQTVYLTSSVLDLSQFEGKKVRVWGETFAAKKAGWLMDVGRIEFLP